MTRRLILQGLVAAVVPAASRRIRAAQVAMNQIGPLDPAVLPAGVRSRLVDNVNGLRMHVLEAGDRDLQLFAGRTLDVPAMFVGGRSDWGVYQNPGALERLERTVTTKYRGTHLVDGAGHWVQQEQPGEVVNLLLRFLRDAT